ncbi:MAG TPA: SHOCT domain-containing protein [Bacteroidia bacterium]|nr:SHOCT domain-containing protein [Bacteroidia bacterium]
MQETVSVIVVAIIIIVIALPSIILYMLPYIISRGKSFSSSVFWFNLLLGWTFIGWIIALVWAVSEDGDSSQLKNQPISNDSISAIEALGQLRAQGYISISEYTQQKQNLLTGQNNLAKNIIALERLGKLYEQNLITYQEFTDQKNKIFIKPISKNITSLDTLKRLHREGLITDQEYLDQKNEIQDDNIIDDNRLTNQADDEIKNNPNARPYNPRNNQ